MISLIQIAMLVAQALAVIAAGVADSASLTDSPCPAASTIFAVPISVVVQSSALPSPRSSAPTTDSSIQVPHSITHAAELRLQAERSGASHYAAPASALASPLLQLAGSPLVQATGWALLHFLWQGGLIAAALWLALRGLRRASSNTRYAVCCAALLLMVALPAATLVSAYSRVLRDSPTRSPAAAHFGHVRASVPAEPPPGWADLLPWVVGVWLAGVAVCLVRLTGAWLAVRRVQRAAARCATDRWRPIVERLARRMSLRRAVAIVETAAASVPTVVGWLRPVILMPLAAVAGLTPQQVEIVLAHELAHIRRHDYLVNLLQAAVEAVLFYHPGVWWVSGRMRQEREYCCDDLAVAVCGNAVCYARTLTQLESLRGDALRLSPSSIGGSLMDRVTRLMERPAPRTARGALWVLPAFSLCSAVGLAGAIGYGVAPGADDKQANATTVQTVQDDRASLAMFLVGAHGEAMEFTPTDGEHAVFWGMQGDALGEWTDREQRIHVLGQLYCTNAVDVEGEVFSATEVPGPGGDDANCVRAAKFVAGRLAIVGDGGEWGLEPPDQDADAPQDCSLLGLVHRLIDRCTSGEVEAADDAAVAYEVRAPLRLQYALARQAFGEASVIDPVNADLPMLSVLMQRSGAAVQDGDTFEMKVSASCAGVDSNGDGQADVLIGTPGQWIAACPPGCEPRCTPECERRCPPECETPCPPGAALRCIELMTEGSPAAWWLRAQPTQNADGADADDTVLFEEQGQAGVLTRGVPLLLQGQRIDVNPPATPPPWIPLLHRLAWPQQSLLHQAPQPVMGRLLKLRANVVNGADGEITYEIVIEQTDSADESATPDSEPK